jgi:hypothetical protein
VYLDLRAMHRTNGLDDRETEPGTAVFARSGFIDAKEPVWIMISPLVHGYTANSGGLGDNLILAILIAAFAICSDGAAGAGQTHPPPGAPEH